MSNTDLERRALLNLIGTGLIAIPFSRARGAEPPSAEMPEVPDTLISEVCAYIQQSATIKLPANVVQKAKHHILDTLTAMVSGAEFKVGRLSREFTKSQGGSAEAQVVGENFLTTASSAAFANGNMEHADETDDSHEASGTHPGCAILPAALAVA